MTYQDFWLHVNTHQLTIPLFGANKDKIILAKFQIDQNQSYWQLCYDRNYSVMKN